MSYAIGHNSTIHCCCDATHSAPVYGDCDFTVTLSANATVLVEAMRLAEAKSRAFADRLKSELVIRQFKVNVDQWPKMPREKPRLRRRGQKQRFGR